MLKLLVPAVDRNLLTLEELHSAVGAEGSEDEANLTRLGLQVSDMISVACRVARAGPKPPTLRLETLAQTIPAGDIGGDIQIARRFVELVSVEQEGAMIDLSSVSLDFSTGLLDLGSCLVSRRYPLRVVFRSGFEEVPGDLSYAAALAVREFFSAAGRDPLLRADTTEGVGRLDFQIGGSGRDAGTALPPATMSLLSAYGSVSLG